VFTGGVVSAQGVPDLTVAVASCDCVSGQGKFSNTASVAILGGFTIPAAAGEQRKDIVVIDATSTVVRRAGIEGAAPAADPVLTEGDVPLARVTLTEGADVAIAAGNLADLRQTVQTVKASKLLPAATADLLVFLATDQITNAVISQAFNAGAFDGSVIAKFANSLWTIAKMKPEVIAVEDKAIAGGNGAGKVGDLFTAPVTVITNPGANLIALPISFDVEFTGTTAYDAAGAGNDLVFRYVGGAEVTLDIDNGNGGGIRLVRAAPGTDIVTIAVKTTETIPLANAGIELFVRGADPYGAAGDIAIKVRSHFRTVPSPLP
jgi:hypothetical protein